jgi:hypothetical protein
MPVVLCLLALHVQTLLRLVLALVSLVLVSLLVSLTARNLLSDTVWIPAQPYNLPILRGPV